jgi:hypothetical protein
MRHAQGLGNKGRLTLPVGSPSEGAPQTSLNRVFPASLYEINFSRCYPICRQQ